MRKTLQAPQVRTSDFSLIILFLFIDYIFDVDYFLLFPIHEKAIHSFPLERYRRAGPPTTSLASRIANMIAHQVANGASTSTSTAAAGQLLDRKFTKVENTYFFIKKNTLLYLEIIKYNF